VPRSVKKRAYDRSSRLDGSAATRRRIVEAAREIFVERGYRNTTIGAIAERAGVNADTVYRLVGRKPVLLRELIEQAISGTDHPVVAEDRDYVRAIEAEPDAQAKLVLYARAMRRIHERMAPLLLAVRDASSTEPEAQAVWRQISDRRATNMRAFVLGIRATGRLRPGLGINEAADTVWVMNSAELYVLLTVERGWSPSRYERWLADSWTRLLLA
jgi:AcrR family transcriptional regulator